MAAVTARAQTEGGVVFEKRVTAASSTASASSTSSLENLLKISKSVESLESLATSAASAYDAAALFDRDAGAFKSRPKSAAAFFAADDALSADLAATRSQKTDAFSASEAAALQSYDSASPTPTFRILSHILPVERHRIIKALLFPSQPYLS